MHREDMRTLTSCDQQLVCWSGESLPLYWVATSPPYPTQMGHPNSLDQHTGGQIPKKLEASRIAARKSRMDANRAQTGRTWEEIVSVSS